VESGVETQRSGAVNVATSRGNSKGVTAASSQDPETNLLNGVKSAQVEAGNNVPDFVVELRAARTAIATAQNMNNVNITLAGIAYLIFKSEVYGFIG